MLSLVQLPIAFGYAVSGGALTFAWHVQQSLISSMMLVVGLFTVISWDATFPDRRDVMILAPLPVAPHSILIAKLAASGCVVALAIAALNVASGVVWPLLFAVRRGTLYAAVQTLAAYWLTMILASVFLYAAVLTVQGLSALLLPRRAFLRVSALLQLGAFVLFLSVYFLQPALTTTASIMAPQNRLLAAWSPTFWFFALFHQLSGTLPSSLYWLAHRAWSALAGIRRSDRLPLALLSAHDAPDGTGTRLGACHLRLSSGIRARRPVYQRASSLQPSSTHSQPAA